MTWREILLIDREFTPYVHSKVNDKKFALTLILAFLFFALTSAILIMTTIDFFGMIYFLWGIIGLWIIGKDEDNEHISPLVILPIFIYIIPLVHCFTLKHVLRERRHIRNTYSRQVLVETIKE